MAAPLSCDRRSHYVGKRMALVEAVPDNNMIVSGYEHQTLRCSTCRVSECRFIFNPGLCL